MLEVENLLQQLLDKMDEMNSTLHEISGKLDNVDGVYGLDDIHSKLGDSVDEIIGQRRYNLTDVHSELTNISSEISNVNTTLLVKD